MEFLVRSYRSTDEAAVVKLWQRVFPADPPWNEPRQVIAAKQLEHPELFFVAELNEQLVGTAIGGYDGHRGWLYSMAVDENHRRQGVGEALLNVVEQGLKRLGCVKLNLQVRASNRAVVDFYRRLGFEVEERVSMGKRLDCD